MVQRRQVSPHHLDLVTPAQEPPDADRQGIARARNLTRCWKADGQIRESRVRPPRG